MEKIYIIICVFFAVTLNSYAQNKTSLNGVITDQNTGESLIGVSVYFPDLKTSSLTDTNGRYEFENLPKTKLLLQISYLGYQQIIEVIDLSTSSTQNFMMKESVTELGEVAITGLSKAAEIKRTPSPISVVTSKQLKQSTATNIIDALTTQPGISQVTTGVGISKPVIRGLGYNRVLVINDGIRQEGQQWGDEHGIEIDEYAVHRVEVLKGPATLVFGSDAMAGVINMQPKPTLPKGSIKGSILTNYQTNNGLVGGSLDLGGNQNDIVWDLRYSRKESHAYKNKWDGYVLNSGFKENALSGMIGVNKAWGYTHLNFSKYNFKPGIIDGHRDIITGQFIKSQVLNDTTTTEVIANKSDFKSYQPSIPYQNINHYKWVLNSHFYLGKGSLKTTFGWQQNQRQEFEEVHSPDEYGLYFFMNTFNYDVHYNFSTQNNIDFSFGINGMYQNSQNKGSEFAIPDYELFDFGLFYLGKKSWEKWTLSGGLRYDYRTLDGKDLWVDADFERTFDPDLYSEHLFESFRRAYKGLSGNIGATYQFSNHLYTKFNFSKGFRAPNIAETSAHGVHEATSQYFIGNPELKLENSYQVDYAFGINSEHVTLEADLFYNQIQNYIFYEKLQSQPGIDSLSDGFQTFKYTQGNAHLYGGEITIDIHPHPLDWIHFENSFSYLMAVQPHQPDSSRYLPFSPAPKWHSEIRINSKNIGNHLTNSYFRVSMDKYFNQNHFYKAYDTETFTPGYTLLNIGLGSDITKDKRTLFSIYISANNITNSAYQSHLSRLKYLDRNNLTGRQGVYNMGRNFSFKLIIPFEITN